MRVYLDSVILVYLLDHTGPFQVRAAQRLAALHAQGDTIAVSDLVRMECRMEPLRKSDSHRLARFDGFFTRTDVELIPLTRSVFDLATMIRAVHGYKPMDALNLAAAVEGNCQVFLTNDHQLRAFPDLIVKVLP
jgi:predicted nucleic acid-binding protein